MEADYDRKMKEAQSQENLVVRWVMGLNKKLNANFTFAKASEGRLLAGDELLLRYPGIHMRSCKNSIFSFQNCLVFVSLACVVIVNQVTRKTNHGKHPEM